MEICRLCVKMQQEKFDFFPLNRALSLSAMDEDSTESKVDDLLRQVNMLVERQKEEVRRSNICNETDKPSQDRTGTFLPYLGHGGCLDLQKFDEFWGGERGGDGVPVQIVYSGWYWPASPKVRYSEGPLFRRSDVYGGITVFASWIV